MLSVAAWCYVNELGEKHREDWEMEWITRAAERYIAGRRHAYGQRETLLALPTCTVRALSTTVVLP